MFEKKIQKFLKLAVRAGGPTSSEAYTGFGFRLKFGLEKIDLFLLWSKTFEVFFVRADF